MGPINGLLTEDKFKKSYATRLPNSDGDWQYRLNLKDDKENRTKIAVRSIFISLTLFFERIFMALGMERKWAKIDVADSKGKVQTLLLNINSLCKRTLLKRDEVIAKSPDELSKLLAQPSLIKPFNYKKLNELFPHAFLINLDSRPDRIDSLQKHLKSIGQGDFSFQRKSAINGKTLPESEYGKMSKSPYKIRVGGDDRPGRYGIYMSHLNALKEAKSKNLPNVLIMEDDIRFMPGLINGNTLQKTLNELPKDWGIFFLGHWDANQKNAKEYSENLVKPGCPYDLHAWMVNGSMYDTLINKLEEELANPPMRGIDEIIGQDLPKTGRLYAAKNHIAIQDEGESSIVNHYTKSNYKSEQRSLHSQFPIKMIKDQKGNKIPVPEVFQKGSETADGMPVMNPLLAGTLYQIMYHIDAIFNKHGIDYWIDGGTALGAERNGSLIPHDDDLDISIIPGQENKLKDPNFIKDLKAVGLQIEDHWLGAKIFASKNHPYGKIHNRDGCNFKAPSIDIFFTEKGTSQNGEEIYKYKNNGKEKYNPALIWAGYYHKASEIFGPLGQRRKIDFGPIKVSGHWNAKDVCKRFYGENCMDEIYLMWDHIKEKGLNRRPIKLTDFRPPAYKQWEGITFVDAFPKSSD